MSSWFSSRCRRKVKTQTPETCFNWRSLLPLLSNSKKITKTAHSSAFNTVSACVCGMHCLRYSRVKAEPPQHTSASKNVFHKVLPTNSAAGFIPFRNLPATILLSQAGKQKADESTRIVDQLSQQAIKPQGCHPCFWPSSESCSKKSSAFTSSVLP